MNCYFCKKELEDTTGQWREIYCFDHAVPIAHARNHDPDDPNSSWNFLHQVSFSLPWPQYGPREKYLYLSWSIAFFTWPINSFLMMFEGYNGNGYTSELIIQLNHLPQDITPENAYQAAERFLKLRVFS